MTQAELADKHDKLLAGVYRELKGMRDRLAESDAVTAEMRAALTELLRLYDWRFELAEREKDPRYRPDNDFCMETLGLLRQYGREKKAAWEVARRVLGGVG